VKTVLGFTTLVLLLCLIGYATSGAPSDPNQSDLGLTASPIRQGNGAWLLQFELRYTGEAPLTVDERSLPWRSPESSDRAFQLNPAGTRLAHPESRTWTSSRLADAESWHISGQESPVDCRNCRGGPGE
jgi:hypothetical protein